MGGAVCNVHRQAVLQFQSIPTNTAQLPMFDKQLRELFNSPTIAESVVSDRTDQVDLVCATLGKTTWTSDDRSYLFGIIESLYEPYT